MYINNYHVQGRNQDFLRVRSSDSLRRVRFLPQEISKKNWSGAFWWAFFVKLRT